MALSGSAVCELHVDRMTDGLEKDHVVLYTYARLRAAAGTRPTAAWRELRKKLIEDVDLERQLSR